MFPKNIEELMQISRYRLKDYIKGQRASRKRSIVETIIDQLKNISGVEHSRHRSPVNFCVNLLCGLIA